MPATKPAPSPPAPAPAVDAPPAPGASAVAKKRGSSKKAPPPPDTAQVPEAAATPPAAPPTGTPAAPPTRTPAAPKKPKKATAPPTAPPEEAATEQAPAKKPAKKRAVPAGTEGSADAADATKKKARKGPAHPRNKSAYDFFRTQFLAARPAVAEGEARPSLATVSKQCAEAWKAVADKAEFEAMAAKHNAEAAAARPPPPPKRPVTGYLAFAVAERVKLKASHPDMDFAALSKRCGEAWKELSAEAQAEWKGAAPGGGDDTASTVVTAA